MVLRIDLLRVSPNMPVQISAAIKEGFTNDEVNEHEVFSDLLYLASDAIDIKFTANVVANV